MKKLYLLLFSLGGFFLTHGQVFEKAFENNDDIQMVVVTQDMFSIINEVNNNPERKQFFNRLTYMGTFSGNHEQAARQIKSKALQYIKSLGMKLLVKIKKPQKNAAFYYLPAAQKSRAKELLILMEFPGSNRIKLYHITGDIDLRRISLLALQSTQLDKSVLQEAEKKVN